MKRIILAFISIILLSGAEPYSEPVESYKVLARNEDRLTIYETAEIVTGTKADILRGLCYAESAMGRKLKHSDPLDKGFFGLREPPEYHKERARKWGEYDPHNPSDSAVIAGHIYMEAYQYFGGDKDKALTAYHRGISWTKKHGIDWKYVAKVMEGIAICNGATIE